MNMWQEIIPSIPSPLPGPAGVAVSALAGALACDLVVKILTIRKADAELIARARTVAGELRDAAIEDTAAVRANDPAAMMQAPLRAARAAIQALHVCQEAAPFATRGHIAADLTAARHLLLGAARGTLVCLDANVALWPDDAAAREVAALWGDVASYELTR